MADVVATLNHVLLIYRLRLVKSPAVIHSGSLVHFLLLNGRNNVLLKRVNNEKIKTGICYALQELVKKKKVLRSRIVRRF